MEDAYSVDKEVIHTHISVEVSMKEVQRHFAGWLRTRSETSGATPCQDVEQVLLHFGSQMMRPLEKGLHVAERGMAAHVGVHTVNNRAERRPLEEYGSAGGRWVGDWMGSVKESKKEKQVMRSVKKKKADGNVRKISGAKDAIAYL